MKKLIIFKSLAVLFIIFLYTVSWGQNPTVTINYNATNLAIGSNISVPVVFNGNDVGSWSLLIRYDRDVLTYVNTTNTVGAPGFFQVFPNYTIQPTYPNAGEIVYKAGLAYSPTYGPGYTYTNQTVITLNFIYNGGVTNISFINISTGTTGNNETYLKTFPLPAPNTSTSAINLLTTYTNGSATGNYGTLTSIAGGGDWATAATWVENKVPSNAYNVFITGNTVTNASTTGKCHNLTLNAGGKLTVASGKSLSVSGNMLIKSDATASGSFVDLGTTTVTGTTTVERYTTGNWTGAWPPVNVTDITWHYIASPVSGATIASYMGSLLNYWNEPANTWTPMVAPTTSPLVVNKGYSAATTSNQVITFTGGTLNTGNQSISGLTNTDLSTTRGFNLIGNAFPSAVIWNTAISRTQVEAAAYLWNGLTYVSHLTTDIPAYEIPAEQGFFVHVTTGSASGSLIIPNTNRVHSSNSYVKSVTSEQLDLKVNGNKMEDATSIRFNSDASIGFDGEYDAYKLWGVSVCPQIYTMTADDNLSINSLPEMTSQTVIPVGFMAGVNDTYSITASGIESFSAGTDIYLEDLLLNKTQNLNSNPVYEFTATAGTGTHRFNIHFSPLSGISDGTTSNIKIYATGKDVFVNIPMELHGSIIVYDLLGKEIKNQPIQGNTLNKINLNVELGYYLVKVLGDKSTVSGKVFIR